LPHFIVWCLLVEKQKSLLIFCFLI
jgi:hypothetical protein